MITNIETESIKTYATTLDILKRSNDDSFVLKMDNKIITTNPIDTTSSLSAAATSSLRLTTGESGDPANLFLTFNTDGSLKELNRQTIKYIYVSAKIVFNGPRFGYPIYMEKI